MATDAGSSWNAVSNGTAVDSPLPGPDSAVARKRRDEIVTAAAEIISTQGLHRLSLAKIERIIDALRHERYRWTPARRVYIAKKNSRKQRPLGIPSWSDKLLQEGKSIRWFGKTYSPDRGIPDTSR